MAKLNDDREDYTNCRFKALKVCQFAGVSCNRIASKTCDVAKSFYDLEYKKCPVMVSKGYKKCGCDYLYIRLFAKQDGVDCAKGGICIVSSFDEKTRRIIKDSMDIKALGEIEKFIKEMSHRLACV